MSQNKHQQQESMAQFIFAQMLALFQLGEGKNITESDEKSQERVFNRCGSPSLVSRPIGFSGLPELQQKPSQPKPDQQERSSESDFECEEFKPKAVVSIPVAENNPENNCEEGNNNAQAGSSFDCSDRAVHVADHKRESLSAAQFEFIRYIIEERVFREINKRTVFTKKHNHDGFQQSMPICVM